MQDVSYKNPVLLMAQGLIKAKIDIIIILCKEML